MPMSTGAHTVIERLLAGGVDVCFANPGTSEMHFVAALDDSPGMRAVLCLFEGVATGAADGYARIAGKPAATLLHLGPGMANGLANLHNARRAHTPVVNVVGEHATYHQLFDPPLHSDIESIAAGACAWTRRMSSVDAIADDVAAAVGASMEAPGQPAALILPADIAWSEAVGAPKKAAIAATPAPSQEAIEAVAQVLRSGEPAAILVNGRAARDRALRVAGRIARHTGA